MQSIDGRVAIVTGASSGIGEGIARELATAGATVVLAARSADRLDTLAGEIAEAGGRALAIPCDVTSEDQIVALFRETVERAGPPDILVNNAGIADKTPIEDLSIDRWHRVIDTNLTSAVLCAREAVRLMKPRGRGRIINIGSISAKTPRPHSLAYTVSKFAIEGLSRQLALDGREFGISASTLHPGATLSNLAPGLSDRPGSDRLLPAELGELVVYMCRLPDDVTMLDTVILPIANPFFGRG